MTLFAEFLLLAFATLLIVLGATGHITAAIIVGIVGILLLLVYSLCHVSGEAAQHEEDEYGIRRS